jgi:hypothetical protein
MRIKTAILEVSLNTHDLYSVKTVYSRYDVPSKMFQADNIETIKKFHTEFYFMFTCIHFTPGGSPLNGTFWNMLPTEMQVYFTSVCPVLYLFPSMHALHLCWEWPFNSDLYMEICMGNDLIPQVSLQSFKILQSFLSVSSPSATFVSQDFFITLPTR